MEPDSLLLIRTALAVAAITVLSIWTLDGPIAAAMSSVSPEAKRLVTKGVQVCEWLFGFRISPYLYSGLLILGGLALRLRNRVTFGRWLIFIGLAQATTRLVAGVLKPPFSRLRPFEALSNGSWHDTWFAVVGNSFPSGHAAHFWGLFFPLALLLPRFWLPLATLPLLISTARVIANDHYLSDVSASASIAALITCMYAKIMHLPTATRGKAISG